MYSLTETPISTNEKRFVWLIVYLYIFISLFVVAYAKVSLPKIDNFAAFCSIIVSFACLQTAYLLYYQSKVYEETSLSILASGYLITSLLTSAYTLIFPNLIFSFQDPNIANQAISWLWYFSHVTFPLFLMIYVLLGSKTKFLFYTTSQWIFRLSPLMAVFLITIAMTSSQLLPAVIEGDKYSLGLGLRLNWIVFFFNFIALSFFLHKMDLSKRQNLWLLLAMIVYQVDVTYAIAGGERYTIGWYLGKVNNVISSSLILAVFNYHLATLAKKLKDANLALNQMATTDSLTQVSNRRKFVVTLENYWNLGLREQKPICLILLDVDYFKMFNDRYGHPAGDECLIRIAKGMKELFKRDNDLIARIGGEEFAVLLYDVDDITGAQMAENLRKYVEEMRFNTPVFEGHQVTISLGCSSIIPSDALLPSHFFSMTDQALYKAKNNGRNQVYCTTEVISLYVGQKKDK